MLKDYNIFDKEYLEELATTAGFRNRFAHDYMKLNKKIVYKSINKILKLYPRYILKIKQALEI